MQCALCKSWCTENPISAWTHWVSLISMLAVLVPSAFAIEVPSVLIVVLLLTGAVSLVLGNASSNLSVYEK